MTHLYYKNFSPEYTKAIKLVQIIQSGNFSAYLVGGCVRDMLMHRTPKDYDIVTNAKPDDLLKLFPNANLVGKQFGVIIEQGTEIATFRQDGIYTDGRRPNDVIFVATPEQDSQRRDFTVNAMYWDPVTDQLLDYHNGQEDLDAHIIRTVGDPEDRINEDYLRMLRAVRFACQLNFILDKDLSDTILNHSWKLAKTARERTGTEIRKAYEANPVMAHYLFQKLVTFNYRENTNTGLILACHKGLISFNSVVLILLRFPYIPLDQLTTACRDLNLSSHDTEDVMDAKLNLTAIQSLDGGESLAELKRLIRRPQFYEAFELYKLMLMFGEIQLSEGYTKLSVVIKQVNQEHDSLWPVPPLDGHDIIRAGVTNGKQIGKLLDMIETTQLNGNLLTREQAIQFVKETQGDSNRS